MSGPFHSLSIAASGMDVYQSWLDAVADNVANINTMADAAAIAGATGALSSVSDYMVAATEAQLTTEVTVAVRNRAIEAFNDIMRMQV